MQSLFAKEVPFEQLKAKLYRFTVWYRHAKIGVVFYIAVIDNGLSKNDPAGPYWSPKFCPARPNLAAKLSGPTKNVPA